MDKTKVVKKESFLQGKSKEDFISELVSLLRGKVLAAYIFGSFVTDKFNADSDLDLLLVVQTATPFIERPLNFPEILDMDVNMNVDLLIYTPEEFAQLVSEQKVGFWKSAFEQMVKII